MKKRIFLCAQLSLMGWAWAQETPQDTISLNPITVISELPITSQVITDKQLEEKNLGQDMPVLLKNATSVVTTSDAGNGIGYTSMRIRGIAQSQINVTFNGVPVNDSESHGVFWVDFPDISSSSDQIVIQRGAGTSSNGAAAFGGSVNLETNKKGNEKYLNLGGAFGSFDTKKVMLDVGSGDFANGKLNVDTRLSYIESDGFLDRASSELFSAATNIRFKPNKNTEFHIMNLFGHERTYQAWYGVNQDQIDANGSSYNPAGAIYDADWNVIGYYDDQVDNYDQNHLHAYWKQKWNDKWKSTTTLHWTRGLGYYEQYKQGETLSEYYIDNGQTTSDLVRRKWLDNHFFGGIFNLEARDLGDFDFYGGLSLNHYIGGHYGKVVDVIDSSYVPSGKYYENESNKTEFSSFLKGLYHIGNIEIFGDVQLRNISYDADYKNGGNNPAEDFVPFDYNWTFINPKAGISYTEDNYKVYASYGLTHREPTRADIQDNPETVKPETLHDFELGYRNHSFINLGINAYYMYYLDQLVLTGQINNVGTPIRENVGKSYRAGIELDFSKKILNNQLNLFGNLNVSKNKNLDFYVTETDGTLTDLGDTSISFSPEIITSFGVEVFPVKGLKINLTNKYVDSQYVTNTEVQEFSLDSYFVSDLLVKYKINIGQTKLGFSLLVNNLFDTSYANNGYWGDWDNNLYMYPQAGTNFLTGINVEF